MITFENKTFPMQTIAGQYNDQIRWWFCLGFSKGKIKNTMNFDDELYGCLIQWTPNNFRFQFRYLQRYRTIRFIRFELILAKRVTNTSALCQTCEMFELIHRTIRMTDRCWFFIFTSIYWNDREIEMFRFRFDFWFDRWIAWLRFWRMFCWFRLERIV